jgi:hypothetical protein
MALSSTALEALEELWDRIQSDDSFRMAVIDAIGADAVESIRKAVEDDLPHDPPLNEDGC